MWTIACSPSVGKRRGITSSLKGDEATRSSSRFVMDDKVFQLQSLSLQYSWRTGFVKKVLHAETVNLSVNMSDLFYLSSIKRERGTDYPFANNIQFAFSVIF